MALLAAAAFAGAGCSSQATPTIESGRPSENVAPKAPDLDRTGLLAALESGEYFLRVHRYATEVGDTASFDDMTLPTCGFCSAHSRAIHDAYGQSGWQRGGYFEFEEGGIPVSADDSDREVQVVFDAELTPATVYDASGAVVRTEPGGSFRIGVNLVLANNAWKVASVSGIRK